MNSQCVECRAELDLDDVMRGLVLCVGCRQRECEFTGGDRKMCQCADCVADREDDERAASFWQSARPSAQAAGDGE